MHEAPMSAAPSSPTYNGLRIAALSLAALLIGAVAYLWLRPTHIPVAQLQERLVSSQLPLPVPAMRTAPAAPALQPQALEPQPAAVAGITVEAEMP